MQDDADRAEYAGKGDGEPVVWYKQTIRNACGLIGVLHAVCNGSARGVIGKTSFAIVEFVYEVRLRC